MAKIVDVVGFGEVEFPDDFDDDRIKDVLRRKFAPKASEIPYPDISPFQDPVTPVTEAGFIPRAGSAIAEASTQAFQGLQRIGQAVTSYTPMGKAMEMVPGLADARESIGGEVQQFARDVQDRSSDDYGVDPRDQRFSSKLIKGASSVVPVLASGGVLAPLTGAALAGESARQDAEARGATQEQQDVAFSTNALVGAVTERLLGVPRILKMAAAKGIGGDTLKAILSRGAITAVKSAPMEATQEAIQQAAENFIASDIAGYDPDRPLKQGVGEAALLGGLIGSGLGGATGTAAAIDDRVAAQQDSVEQSVEQNQVPQDVQFTEHGTVIVQGQEYAVQDDVLKPVVPGSQQAKAIESIVGQTSSADVQDSVVDETTTETRQPETEPQQSNVAETGQLPGDFERQEQLEARMMEMIDADQTETPEFEALQQEKEEIKNRNGGMPAQAPVEQSVEQSSGEASGISEAQLPDTQDTVEIRSFDERGTPKSTRVDPEVAAKDLRINDSLLRSLRDCMGL